MIINTKYELLQEVWCVLEENASGLNMGRGSMGFVPCSDCRQIHGVFVDHEGVIYYHLEKYRGPFKFKYLESEIYPTEMALLADYPSLRIGTN